MRPKLLGFFSGFPSRHFTDEIAMRLEEELSVRESLVFVSAWPSDFSRNDDDAAGMHGMFAERGMTFRRYHVIDGRTGSAEARRLVREASCIFLMGGHAVQQFQLIRDKGIGDEIRGCGAVVLGVSAGAVNMARRAVDIYESLLPYDGLGLADITVKAHFNFSDENLVGTLRTVSMALPVCAMEDESAIFVKGSHAEIFGSIHLIDKGIITTLAQEWLENRTAG